MNDIEDAVADVPSVAMNVFPQLRGRYGDGYTAARAIIEFGNLVKIIGAVAGCIIVGVVAIISVSLFLGGVVLGGLAGLGLYVCGVMICAQGQLLLATLDSAVNNSPFLNNPQRASIMFSCATLPLASAPPPAPPVAGIRA